MSQMPMASEASSILYLNQKLKLLAPLAKIRFLICEHSIRVMTQSVRITYQEFSFPGNPGFEILFKKMISHISSSVAD